MLGRYPRQPYLLYFTATADLTCGSRAVVDRCAHSFALVNHESSNQFAFIPQEYVRALNPPVRFTRLLFALKAFGKKHLRGSSQSINDHLRVKPEQFPRTPHRDGFYLRDLETNLITPNHTFV